MGDRVLSEPQFRPELRLRAVKGNRVSLPHVRNPIGIVIENQAPHASAIFRHGDRAIAQNGAMTKAEIRQVLARNLRQAMDRTAGLETQSALAKKTGISQSHLSDVLNCVTSTGVDLLADLADALDIQPWELLADSEETKRSALARLMWGSGVSDKEVERYLPLPPKGAPAKEGAPKRKKPGGSASRPNDS